MNAITESTKFSIPALNEGETYVGAIVSPDGTGNHVILLSGDNEETDWEASMEWAESIGGDLPDRVEQALLFKHHKDQFKPDWYWSNTQHASDASYAWSQDFYHGTQYDRYKIAELRARAVRRLAI